MRQSRLILPNCSKNKDSKKAMMVDDGKMSFMR